MNGSLPKSRTWWLHHLSVREISQAENKSEWLAKITFPLANKTFGTAINTIYREEKKKKDAIFFLFRSE